MGFSAHYRHRHKWRSTIMSASLETGTRPHALARIIDLEHYPIDRPDTPEHSALVSRCRKQLNADGCVVLKNFIRPAALIAIRDETEQLAPQAHYNQTHTNPYNSDGDPALAPEHPKNVFGDRSNG